MKVTMSSDEKHSTTEPTFVITAPPQAAEPKKSGKLTKKHALIAVVSLVIAALVVVAVLVGIRLVKESELEILKYSMTTKDGQNNNVQQNVSVIANIVQYHVVKGDSEAWIINDFDRDVQVMKIKQNGGTAACYATPLNRSEAADPNSIPSEAPTTDANTPSRTLLYKVSETAISDVAFLGARVQTMCQGVPTYWLKPHCGDANNGNTSQSGEPRNKRTTYYYTTLTDHVHYRYGVYPYRTVCNDWYGSNQPCSCGCGTLVCGALYNTVCWYATPGYWNCVWTYNHLCYRASLAPTNNWAGYNYGGNNAVPPYIC